ncbi:32284_t:CDS:1 [Gigaspora margarita]|uniref:32284_t:CDS:1 n=1 Tax=Gigaspora margarita TaxID=4874 RepID=A0ABN7VK02_GIGMA|nr:32284_t:CDS:1 [Gigaspora margarita]
METVIEARDIPFVKETKPADTKNPVAPKLINKPSKIHTHISKTSANEKRSVGFIIPEGFGNSHDGSEVVRDDDSTVVSTPIDEFFLNSPSSSLDISVRDLNSNILVALVDREVEIKDLFARNQDFFDFVKQTFFSSDDRWQEFLNVLFSPRKQISDFNWMETISELLSPPLLVQFKVIVGYYDHYEENDNVDENDSDDDDSVYPSGTDSPFGCLDIASIRDYPKSLEYLEISYPQFFANARQILSQEKHRKGSILGGNHLTDDIPLQFENDTPEPTNSLYDEFKRILLRPRSEMDDVEWDISIYELLDPWPQLVAQFEEIIAHEVNE